MGYRRKTLRRMPTTTRKLARLITEMESVIKRAKNLMPEIESLEHDSIALYRVKQAEKSHLSAAELGLENGATEELPGAEQGSGKEAPGTIEG